MIMELPLPLQATGVSKLSISVFFFLFPCLPLHPFICLVFQNKITAKVLTISRTCIYIYGFTMFLPDLLRNGSISISPIVVYKSIQDSKSTRRYVETGNLRQRCGITRNIPSSCYLILIKKKKELITRLGKKIFIPCRSLAALSHELYMKF